MAPIKVLLIEDTIGIPMLKILEKWGYDVTLAEDGEQAWSIVNERLFDIFLVDWVLPGMSGPDLIIQIRELKHYECTPIVMISGKAEQTDVVTAIGSGVDHYITKPFTAVQLRDKIADVWQYHQRQKNRQPAHRARRSWAPSVSNRRCKSHCPLRRACKWRTRVGHAISAFAGRLSLRYQRYHQLHQGPCQRRQIRMNVLLAARGIPICITLC